MKPDSANGNAPATASNRGAELTKLDEQMNFDTFHGFPQPAPALAMLTAGLQAAGYSLYELADGTYMACRWGYSRALVDLYAVRGFLRQIAGGAQ